MIRLSKWDEVLEKALYKRHGELACKIFMSGLTPKEEAELNDIRARLDELQVRELRAVRMARFRHWADCLLKGVPSDCSLAACEGISEEDVMFVLGDDYDEIIKLAADNLQHVMRNPYKGPAPKHLPENLDEV